jgi:hypothetical protein
MYMVDDHFSTGQQQFQQQTNIAFILYYKDSGHLFSSSH